MKMKGSRDKLDEEKIMIREMVGKGMSFAEVARQIGVDYQWVYRKCGDIYIKKEPVKKKKLTKAENIQAKLDNIDRELKRVNERKVKVEEEINCPLDRSFEELVEYRKRKDREQKVLLKGM